MATVINFNKARKQRDRVEAEGQAAANRLRHGRSKAEKARVAHEEEDAQRRLEGHLRISDTPADDEPA